MTDLTPQTPIETLLKAAMDGAVPIRAFMEAFLASEVVLLTGSLVTPDGTGFDPLLLDQQGTLPVAVFTDPAPVSLHTPQAPPPIPLPMPDVPRPLPRRPGPLRTESRPCACLLSKTKKKPPTTCTAASPSRALPWTWRGTAPWACTRPRRVITPCSSSP